MGSKQYVLRLTGEELWALGQSFEAAFTDMDARSETDLAVQAKLDKLNSQRHRDRLRSRLTGEDGAGS